MSRAYRVFIDTFSGLDDLPKKHHGYPDKVLEALRASGGRFSDFELTPKLADSLCVLVREKRIAIDPNAPGYPWYKVNILGSQETDQ